MSATTLEKSASNLITLNNSDRCDRCGAQAFVAVSMKSGAPLLFCGHHFNENETKLIAQGGSLSADQRSTINAKPSQSSANV